MQRYFHEGAVMELVPGKKPSMKLVNAINPTDSIDGGITVIYNLNIIIIRAMVNRCLHARVYTTVR